MSDYGGGDDEPYTRPCRPALLMHRFDDTYDAGNFIYEEEELEPPPPDGREDGEEVEDETQLNHVSDMKQSENGVVNGTATKMNGNQVIAAGEVRAATAESKAIPPDQRSTT